MSLWVRKSRNPRPDGRGYNPWRQCLREDGRRNRLPHRGKPCYRTVGQAVSPVRRLFQQLAKREMAHALAISAHNRSGASKVRGLPEAQLQQIRYFGIAHLLEILIPLPDCGEGTRLG
jgi:hypothetical protein